MDGGDNKVVNSVTAVYTGCGKSGDGTAAHNDAASQNGSQQSPITAARFQNGFMDGAS